MTIKIKSCLYLLFIVSLSGCEPNLSDDPIPYVPFSDISLNLNLPAYNSLKTVGNYVELNGSGEGVRGIIVYHKNPSTYLAFERNCSFQPNSACATVDIDVSGLFMSDPCCGSSFNFDGNVLSGPAFRPLRQYETILHDNTLTITDEITN